MLVMTPVAQDAVRRILTEGGERLSGKALRIAVETGGCSGMQYAFRFSEKEPADEVLLGDGFEIVVDEQSLPYLEGCIVDFVDGVEVAGGAGSTGRKQGFTIENPNAASQCGCGKSFSA